MVWLLLLHMCISQIACLLVETKPGVLEADIDGTGKVDGSIAGDPA